MIPIYHPITVITTPKRHLNKITSKYLTFTREGLLGLDRWVIASALPIYNINSGAEKNSDFVLGDASEM